MSSALIDQRCINASEGAQLWSQCRLRATGAGHLTCAGSSLAVPHPLQAPTCDVPARCREAVLSVPAVAIVFSCTSALDHPFLRSPESPPVTRLSRFLLPQDQRCPCGRRHALSWLPLKSPRPVSGPLSLRFPPLLPPDPSRSFSASALRELVFALPLSQAPLLMVAPVPATAHDFMRPASMSRNTHARQDFQAQVFYVTLCKFKHLSCRRERLAVQSGEWIRT